MNAILDQLNGLPPSAKWCFSIGTILLLGGFGATIADLMIPPELRYTAIGVGITLSLLGMIINERQKDIEFRKDQMRLAAEAQRRTDDLTMRKSLLDAGGDPADDKTVFRMPDDND